MALAQCERFFLSHPELKRVPAEDTAGSVRDVLASGDKSAAGVAGRQAVIRYGGVILSEGIQDNNENFTRFVLLIPDNNNEPTLTVIRHALTEAEGPQPTPSSEDKKLKMSIALRLAHKPGALIAALEPFARHGINLMKIESRPIHGSPWVYQFFLDVESSSPEKLEAALSAVWPSTSFLRVLGFYSPARSQSTI